MYRPAVHVHDLELAGWVRLRNAGKSFLDRSDPQRVQYVEPPCSAQNLRSFAISVKIRLLVLERLGTRKARRKSSLRVAFLRRRSDRLAALVSFSCRTLVDRRITRDGRCCQCLSLDSLVHFRRGISKSRMKRTRCRTFTS